MTKSREQMVEDLLDEKEHEELVQLSEKAKDTKVVSIRKQFEDHGSITERQAAVLAGWIADEALEFGDLEDDE